GGHLAALGGGNLDLGPGDARARVTVGPAADGHQRDGALVVGLDALLGVAGPVAADAVVRQGDAVAGVGGEDGPEVTLLVAHRQQGEVVIDRAGGVAAVDGEAHLADAPAQPGRAAVGQGGEGDLLQVAHELPGVAVDVVLVVPGDGHAEQGGAGAG